MKWSRISSIVSFVFWTITLFALSAVLYNVYKTETNKRKEEKSSLPPLIRVMTYSSLMTAEGAGPVIKQLYEKKFGGEIEFVDGGDSALMVKKLKTLPEKQIDLVMGLSLLHLHRAARELNWRRGIHSGPIDLVPELSFLKEIISTKYDRFTPYEWAPMTFVYRENEVSPPTSWNELDKEVYRRSTTAQDPRFSIPGNHLAFWAWDGKNQNFFSDRVERLREILLPLSPSWSVSYGIFVSQNAKMTFTYATSPLYHRLVEKDFRYQAARFSEPHPYEVEWAAIPNHCVSCNEAKMLVQFLLSAEVQKVLMEKNFMLPVVPGVKNNTPFAEVPEFPLISIQNVSLYDDSQTDWAGEFVKQINKKNKDKNKDKDKNWRGQ